MSDTHFQICVLPGDGIGTEVTAAALTVLEAAISRVGHVALNFGTHAAGAGVYRETGVAMPDESWRAAEDADAIFLGLFLVYRWHCFLLENLMKTLNPKP